MASINYSERHKSYRIRFSVHVLYYSQCVDRFQFGHLAEHAIGRKGRRSLKHGLFQGWWANRFQIHCSFGSRHHISDKN
jgi:hypothetical protein